MKRISDIRDQMIKAIDDGEFDQLRFIPIFGKLGIKRIGHGGCIVQFIDQPNEQRFAFRPDRIIGGGCHRRGEFFR